MYPPCGAHRAHDPTVLAAADFRRLAGEGTILAAGALASAEWGALRQAAPDAAAQTMGFGSLILGLVNWMLFSARSLGGSPSGGRRV